jgi:hypothetical protein
MRLWPLMIAPGCAAKEVYMLNEEMIYDEAFAEKVKRSFWRDGLILAMPSQLKKRKVLLDLIVEDFETGRRYTEQEVNFRILDHYDDYCTIRREMVDFGLLKREKGLYYRN